MAEGFGIRNRVAHLPDHVRRLELISGTSRSPPNAIANHAAVATDDGSSPRRDTSFRPLATPQFARDLVARFEHAPALPLTALGGSDADNKPERADGHSNDALANVFGNLSVWIDANLHKCAFHVGFDKIRLYALFLRCFLDDLLPHDAKVQRALQQLDAYVRYLSSSNVHTDPLTHMSGSSTSHAQLPTTQVKGSSGASFSSASPRQPALRTDRLSPKANFQSAALVPQMLSLRKTGVVQSPRQHRHTTEQALTGDQQPQQQQQGRAKPKTPQQLTYPSRKKIVHMSDHEECILELVLYFEETLRKMGGSQSSCKTKSPTKTKVASNGTIEYTTQWLLLSSDEKHRVLRRRKRQLARHEFFPCAAAYNSVVSALVNGNGNNSELKLISALIAARSTSGIPASSSSKPPGPEDHHNHKMELASYFSLIVLCLHEAIRRVSVFSLELAEFAWKVLCDDALALCESMFATILRNQKQSQKQLCTLKAAKMELQQQILDLEGEIQRLQTQNMRSLTMCNLEKQEFLHLEREEQWHGHCKALIVDCVAQLQDAVNTSTWLQKQAVQGNEGEGDETEGGDTTDDSQGVDDGDGNGESHQRHLGDYQRLAPGFAAFHFRNRFQVIYVAHLVLLCRSYLHLHERRGVRDVMSSTSISSPTTNSSSSTTGGSASGDTMDHLFAQTGGDDWHQSQQQHQTGERGSVAATTGSFFLGSAAVSPHRGSINPMEKISLSELHTLREINDALRAIEVLYAETGVSSSSNESLVPGSSEANAKKPKLRRPRALQRSIGTQFPAMDAGNAHSFLRSLSYCTIAATTISASSSLSSLSTVTFLPAGVSAKLQADIVAHHEKVVVTPVGSGRRRSSVRFKGTSEASAMANVRSSSSSSHQQQPQIRLNKALLKLPRHVRELLVLTLVLKPDEASNEQFPAADPARSIATCMSKHELVDKIHWIYRLALDNAYATGFSSSSSSGSDMLPVSLAANHFPAATGSQAAWTTCESFVEFIYSLFFDAENGDLERCEREFVRFFASIQLFLGNSSSSSSFSPSSALASNPTSPSSSSASGGTSSLAHETIFLFALLTKLFHLQSEPEANKQHQRERKALPSRVFAMLFYCQRVLLHVSVSKKLIENSGLSMDVWTLQTAEDMNNWGRRAGMPPPVVTKSVPPSSPSKRAQVMTSNANAKSSTPFVLLESVKALLLHVVSFAFAPDVASLLEEKYQLLLDKSVVATVSLVTPVTPGPYNLNLSSSASSSSGNAPNGQLSEAQILPMDLAVSTIVRCWVHVHFAVEHQLGITLQGALMDRNDGCLVFEEFVHVMTAQTSANGTQSSGSMGSMGSASTLSRARLAQIYAAAQTKASGSLGIFSLSSNRSNASPHWKQLLSAVVDNVDILGMHERFVSVDFRSIQQSLLAPGSSPLGSFPLASWLLSSSAPSRSGGTTQALLKSWQLHRKSMRDHIALAFQAESALDGVRCWQTGTLRLDKVQSLLTQATRDANSSRDSRKKRCSAMAGAPGAIDAVASEKEGPLSAVAMTIGNAPARTEDEGVQELEPEPLSVAWKAYQLLQWDHARAHHFADQVRVKQQRMQKNAVLLSTPGTTTALQSVAVGSSRGAQSVQQQQPQPLLLSGKAEEIRPQRPALSTKVAAQRPQRS